MNELEIKQAINQYGQLLQSLRNEATNQDPLTQLKTNRMNNELNNMENSIKNQRPIMNQNDPQNETNKAVNDYNKAFQGYLRYGSESELNTASENPALPKDLQKDSSGFSANYDMSNQINDRMIKNSAIRQFAKIINISKDCLDFAVYKNEIIADWGDDRTVAAETDAFEKKLVRVNDLTAQPKITQKMVDDQKVDIENWIAELLSDIFLEKEDAAFINGDGNNKPYGILTSTSVERISNGNTINISLDSLLALQASLHNIYEKEGEVAFIASKKAVSQIRTLKDDSGRYVWTSGILQNKQDFLFGVPLISTGAMPNLTANGDAVIYGNFRKGYQIIDRSDIKIQRDPFSSKPFLVYYATKRVGGDIIDSAAMKSLKMSV